MLADGFFRDRFLNYKPTALFVDEWLSGRRRPTVESITRDVEKLRSVSAAGRAWIADRRMAIASVGPWRDTIQLRRKGEPYPAIFVKHRQECVSYSITMKTPSQG